MKNKMFIKNVKVNDEVKVEYRNRWIRSTVIDITNDIVIVEIKTYYGNGDTIEVKSNINRLMEVK